MRSLKYYFVLPVFHLYHGIRCVWPASWLKVFFAIQVKFSLSFTKLLIQSVCEPALTAAYFYVEKWVRSNRNGDVFCGKNCFGLDLMS